MKEETAAYLMELAEWLDAVAEELDSLADQREKSSTPAERMFFDVMAIRDEMLIHRYIDPRWDAQRLRELAGEHLYGANLQGPTLFEE